MFRIRVDFLDYLTLFLAYFIIKILFMDNSNKYAYLTQVLQNLPEMQT